MENNGLSYLLRAHEIYRNGLIAEDTALSSRSNNLLTFNSLLAIAFVGTLQEGFNLCWKPILLFGIPIFAITLNIIWTWLGCRTMLSFIFYFKKMEEVENDLKDSNFIIMPYLKHFKFTNIRSEYWKKSKRCLFSLVSVKAGANIIFCLVLPQITYIVWVALFAFVINIANYMIEIIIGILILSPFTILAIKIIVKIYKNK